MNLRIFILLIQEWGVCSLVGYGLVFLLLPRQWHRERLLLMPVLGAGEIILLSSYLSYAGAGMRIASPIVFGLGVLLSATVYISNYRDSRSLLGWPAAVYANLLGLSAAAAALASVILYNAWNPYNDAFTYVSIADYLLDHSFFTPADPGAYQPILTQMMLYQRVGLRMGSNFLLAFFAAFWGSEYSFDVYMPTLALGLWLAVSGFWVFCRRGLFLSPLASGFGTFFYALSFSVPISNALLGFMPQTWGTVFMLPMIPLYLCLTTHWDRKRMLISAGFMGALLLLTYSEIFPLVFAAIGTSILYRLISGKARLKDHLIPFFGSSLLIIILAPFAAWKFPKAVVHQMFTVVGWDVKLRFWDYLSMVAGLRSSFQWQASAFLLSISLLISAMTLTIVLYAFIKGPSQPRRQAVSLSLIFVLALVWFAFFVANPWNPSERGHPWSTYKIVTYVFFLFAAMVGLGLSMLWKKKGWFRLGAAGMIGVYVLMFSVSAVKTARITSLPMLQFTGVKENPVAEYKRIRHMLSDLPPETPVNLVFPPEAVKHRQMVAYFLRRPVIANWMDDHYLWPWFLPPYRSLPINFSYPVLSYKPSDPRRAVANLVLDRDPQVLMLFGAGWHGLEQDGKSWWRWLEKEGEVLVTLQKESRLRFKGETAVVGTGHRTLTIRVEGRPDLCVYHSLGESWFTPFTSKELKLPQGTYKILFSADGPVARMGKDPRNIRMGFKNLSCILVDQKREGVD